MCSVHEQWDTRFLQNNVSEGEMPNEENTIPGSDSGKREDFEAYDDRLGGK